MRFVEAPYREMASPLLRWEWKGLKLRLTLTSQLLPWAGAASKQFVANMGAARPSLPAGFKNELALPAASQQVKSKFLRQKLPFIAGRRSIVASQNGSQLPIPQTVRCGRSLMRG